MQPAFETEETDDLHLTEAELAELHALSERCKAHPEELSTWQQVKERLHEKQRIFRENRSQKKMESS